MDSSISVERGTYGAENMFGLIQYEANALGRTNMQNADVS